MQTRQALTIAKEQGLDLVLVSPTAVPPVVRIIDYGRHKYETDKLKRDKKPKQQEVKGIKISPRIAEHDLGFLVKNAIRFLEDGNKVKVTCQFKAREITHPEIGRKKLDIFAEHCTQYAVVERTPTLDGKLMIMVLVPKPNLKKNAKDTNQSNSGQAIQDHRDGEDNPTGDAQRPPVPAQESVAEAEA